MFILISFINKFSNKAYNLTLKKKNKSEVMPKVFYGFNFLNEMYCSSKILFIEFEDYIFTDEAQFQGLFLFL